MLYTLAIAASALALYLGALASGVIVFVLATCLVMLLFAVYLARWVVNKDEGTADMQEVSGTAVHVEDERSLSQCKVMVMRMSF